MTSCLHGFICDCPACVHNLCVESLVKHDDLIKEMITSSTTAVKDSMKDTIEALKDNWMYVSVHHKHILSSSVPFLIRLNKTLLVQIARSASYPDFGIDLTQKGFKHHH